MTLRRVIFWIHMVVGVSAGLIILLVSSTGVLLSYEKEILGWSGHSFVERAAAVSGVRLPLNALIASAKEANGGKTPSSLTFLQWQRRSLGCNRRPDALLRFRIGEVSRICIDPGVLQKRESLASLPRNVRRKSKDRAGDYRRHNNRLCLPDCGGPVSLVSSRPDLVQGRAEGQSQKLELA